MHMDTNIVSLLLLLFYPFVVPVDLSQQAKSAAADGLTYSDSIDPRSTPGSHKGVRIC
jgi:hypothetical protein